MQAPQGADLEDQKSPSTFLAELRSLEVGSPPGREVTSRARAQLGRLSLEAEPDWFVGIIKQLRSTQTVTSRHSPKWGCKSWQSEEAQAIVIPWRAVVQVAARSWSLWFSVVAGLAVASLALTRSIDVGWVAGWQGVVARLVVAALLIAPIAMSILAARTSLIYRSRLWLHDREEVAAAEWIISRWEGQLRGSEGVGKSVASRVFAALKVLLTPCP